MKAGVSASTTLNGSSRTALFTYKTNWVSTIKLTKYCYVHACMSISFAHPLSVCENAAVFKYDPPSANNPGYSVYLLPNFWSYVTCDFSKAQLLAGANQGGGEGFKVELNQWRPYYFASGDKDGYNCKDGLMKLFAVPLPRWNNWWQEPFRPYIHIHTHTHQIDHYMYSIILE